MEQLENEKQENENEKLENENQIFRRRLPPELLAEMHKCLPLAAAIHVLVNVPSRAIYQNNSPRMRRTIERLKTWLNQYIDTMVFDGRDINREKLVIYNEIQWKPQLDLLLRYGAWLTSTRLVYFFYSIVGLPENFVEDLLLHMANSSSTQMMLHYVQMNFLMAPIPIPTSFFEQLLNNKEQYRQIGDRFLFESIHLETDDGQILHIYDGELSEYYNLNSTLCLVVLNKMDRTNWFEIAIFLDQSKKFIWKLEFTRFSMQSLEEFNDPAIEQNGNKLEAKRNIYWSPNFELFLRRGVAFTQFRHFKIQEEYGLLHADYYADFLISSISNAKHPEEFLESIEINFDKNYSNSKLIEKLWKVFYEGIPDDGKFMNFDNEKLYILSAKSKPEKKWYELQFTMANLPTNGQYVFDIDIQLDVGVQSAGVEGLDQIVGIKIQKRKIDKIDGIKSSDQIDNELGKKRKAANEEDEPTCSIKIMKKMIVDEK